MHFLREILRMCPEQFPRCVSFIFMGYHCYRYTSEYILPKIDEGLAATSDEKPSERRQSPAQASYPASGLVAISMAETSPKTLQLSHRL
jgi:hypothetical protein